ncbi:hypothetical protein D3C80_309470 [compost metagenome]
MVTTIWVMLLAFSLRMPNLALTRSAAPITWCMVSSMRARPCWPEPARLEAWSAAEVTSVMVRTRSREVAAISREVAPISVVVAAVSVAVACCCLEVAAISVTEVVTCTDERWAWDTRLARASAISLKPLSMAPNSSLRSRLRRMLRSPERSLSRAWTMRCMGAVMARISNRPQIPAAMIASSSETIMLPLAVLTALTISLVSVSAEARLCSITSFR